MSLSELKLSERIGPTNHNGIEASVLVGTTYGSREDVLELVSLVVINRMYVYGFVLRKTGKIKLRRCFLYKTRLQW